MLKRLCMMEAWRKKKTSTDVNVTAFEIMQTVTGQTDTKPTKKKNLREKNPAAVVLGCLGGLKGGVARAAKLTAEKRIEIAKKAARVRWKS